MKKDNGFSEVRIRQIKEAPLYSDTPISMPEDAIAVMSEILSDYDREVFGVINMDIKNRPLNFNIVSVGGLSEVYVSGRETVKSSVMSNAASVIMFHVHPSGDPLPSQEDINITSKLKTAYDALDIGVLDHVIFGSEGKYYSMQENKILPAKKVNSTNISDISFSVAAEKSDVDYGKNPYQREMDEIMERLEEGIAEVFDGEKYKNYLETMSKFPTYSMNNQLLIFLQNPNASKVCGFNKWKKDFNRHVKKGEKGLRILAPSPYKVEIENALTDDSGAAILDANGDPMTEKTTVERVGYRPVSVFDVSQTDGEPLPGLITELDGDVSEYAVLFKALNDISPVPVSFEDIRSGAKGYFSREREMIAVNKGMSQIQNVKTLVHEIAHATLHNREEMEKQSAEKDRQTREVEAESVAFAVCSHFGIDTSDYSFGYLGGWSSGRDLKELRSSLETIRNTASKLIDEIETRVNEIKKDPDLVESLAAAELIDEPEEVTYHIMQLKNDRLAGQNKFLGLDRIERLGFPFNADDYNEMYAGTIPGGDDPEICERLYSRFNTDRPADFEGHSLSVSDVIVLESGGNRRCYYCDEIGFSEKPDFYEPVQDKVPFIMGYTIYKDGLVNNATAYYLYMEKQHSDERSADVFSYKIYDKDHVEIKAGEIDNSLLSVYEAAVEALEENDIHITTSDIRLYPVVFEEHRDQIIEANKEPEGTKQGGSPEEQTETETKEEVKTEEHSDKPKRTRKKSNKEKIEDFGEKIGGARKDVWKERGLVYDDLEYMNEAERSTYVKKDNIWIKPDYKELNESGVPREVCYFIKNVRDCVPTKPKDTMMLTDEEEQERYINFVTAVRDAVMGCKNLEDAERVSTFLEDNGYVERLTAYSSYYPTDLAGPYINTRLFKAMQMGSNPKKLVREAGKKNFLMTEDEVLIKEYAFLPYLKDAGVMEISEDNSGREMMHLRSSGGFTYLYPENDDVKLSDLVEGEWFIAKGSRVIASGFQSEPDARAYALNIEKEKEKTQPDKTKKKRKTALRPVQLEHVERTGGMEYRNGPATGDDYLNDFGFRGGEFGNWTNQLDRQTSLDMGYDAFRDLAIALNISDQDVALNGTLSIAFGARGRGNALAHYEPLREVINLTKMKGAGSLGHEWIHAMDDHVGKAVGVVGDSTMLSESMGYGNIGRIPESFKDLMRIIKKKTLTGDKKIAEYERRAEEECRKFRDDLHIISSSFKSQDPELKEKREELINAVVEEAKTSFRYSYYDYNKNGKIVRDTSPSKAYSDFILFQEQHGDKNPSDRRNRIWANSRRAYIGDLYNRLKNRRNEITDIVIDTDFLRDAKYIDTNHSKSGHGYWASDCELLARAGAAYIKDKCEELGIRNDYLSGHADSKPVTDGDRNYYTSPQGEERKAINKAFDRCFDELRQMGLFKENPMYKVMIEQKKEEEMARENESLNPDIIKGFYVIDDLAKAPFDLKRFDTIDEALDLYFAYPTDGLKALGASVSFDGTIGPLELDLIQCKDGTDTVIDDYLNPVVNIGWRSKEMMPVMRYIKQAVRDHLGMYQNPYKTGMSMQESIKEWYEKEYPDDPIGNEINEARRFRDIVHGLNNRRTFYDITGINPNESPEDADRFKDRLFGEIGKRLSINPERLESTLEGTDTISELYDLGREASAQSNHALSLAVRIDSFTNDYDPYEYMDTVDDRLDHIEDIKQHLLSGNVERIQDYMEEVVIDNGEFANRASVLYALIEDFKTEEPVKRYMEKAKEKPEKRPARITFYTAECSEYHRIGLFKDGMKSIEEAIDVYNTIDPDNMSGNPSIGVRLSSSNKLFEGTELDLMRGGEICINGLYDAQGYLPEDIKPLNRQDICLAINELSRQGYGSVHDYNIIFTDKGYAKTEFITAAMPEIAGAVIKEKYPDCTIKDIKDMSAERLRTVAITEGMSEDCMVIRTTAPKEKIEEWCGMYSALLEDGRTEEPELFASLKERYEVELIYSSDIGRMDPFDVREMVRGAAEAYDIYNYEGMDSIACERRTVYHTEPDDNIVVNEDIIPDEELAAYDNSKDKQEEKDIGSRAG